MNRTLGRKLKDAFIGCLWGNRFYRSFLEPLDRYTVDVRPARDFAPGRPSLNKLCRRSDADDPDWRKGFGDLLFPDAPELFHRKIWEYCQVLYGLRRLRRLSPDAVCLGIGCGHEEIMYFLANRVRQVCATDLYRDRYLGGEADADVIAHPDKYAPFRFRDDHLHVARMDARELAFDDESFDFIFCLSALEHFGGRKDKGRALGEMGRVLKPGGIVALTTELILNRLGGGKGYFRLDELRALIRKAGFVLEDPLDLAVEEEFGRSPLALPMEVGRTPHLILRNFRTIYTSLSLFLVKPEASGEASGAARTARTGDEVERPTQAYEYRARIEVLEGPGRVRADRSILLRVRLENAGDAVWYCRSTFSHMVRLGVEIRGSDGRPLDLGLPHFELPRDIHPGESADLEILLPALNLSGVFELHLDLVQELRFWFRSRGSPVTIHRLEAA
jgi:SAM-dependent methyltransferase